MTRDFTLAPGSNRLQAVSVGAATMSLQHDANGNMEGQGTSRFFAWDHSDRMHAFRTQAGSSEPSVHAHYLYSASGARVKKLVRKQGGRIEVTVYIDGVFEHQRIIRGARSRRTTRST
jgi:hypothetical protein